MHQPLTEEMQSYGSSQLCRQILARICFLWGLFVCVLGWDFFLLVDFFEGGMWGWGIVLVDGILSVGFSFNWIRGFCIWGFS